MRMRLNPLLLAPLLGLALAGQSPPPAPAPATAPASTPMAREALMRALGHAIQGDVNPALDALRTVPAAQFSAPADAIRTCMLDRFGPAAVEPSMAANLPATTARVLAIYRAYWRRALLNPNARAAEEERLRRELADLLGTPPGTDMSGIEDRLTARIEAEGLHALTGSTPPLRELMLWRSQTSEMRAVALPEGVHNTRVVMLDDFASFGWLGFATCERNYSGGWVRPDGIYAVRPGWEDLGGEAFLVSFLGHEAQHFADKERYGELASWELEFRAKLTELALADRTLARLLEAFDHNQSDDSALPHPFANARVLAALRSRLGLAADAPLGAVAPAAIRAAALAELRADSARRRPRAR